MAGRRRPTLARRMRPANEEERQPWMPLPVAELIARIEAALRDRRPD